MLDGLRDAPKVYMPGGIFLLPDSEFLTACHLERGLCSVYTHLMHGLAGIRRLYSSSLCGGPKVYVYFFS